MTKCDFCKDELEAGGTPACVAACPTRALTFGEFDELTRDPNLGSQEAIAPLPDHGLTTLMPFEAPQKRQAGRQHRRERRQPGGDE